MPAYTGAGAGASTVGGCTHTNQTSGRGCAPPPRSPAARTGSGSRWSSSGRTRRPPEQGCTTCCGRHTGAAEQINDAGALPPPTHTHGGCTLGVEPRGRGRGAPERVDVDVVVAVGLQAAVLERRRLREHVAFVEPLVPCKVGSKSRAGPSSKSESRGQGNGGGGVARRHTSEQGASCVPQTRAR